MTKNSKGSADLDNKRKLDNKHVNEDFLSDRLGQLRIEKKVSARDMSISIGQNQAYINKIERGLAMPSMSVFFYICDFLEISPSEFFDKKTASPAQIKEISRKLRLLTPDQLNTVNAVIDSILNRF